MPRPLKADRPIEKNISLPTSLVARVDLLLFSELEQRVPFGAWQRLVEGLLREYLARVDAAAASASAGKPGSSGNV